MIKSRIALLGFIYIIIILTIGPSLAGLKINGVLFKADVSPGDNIDHEVTLITNNGDDTLDLNVSIKGIGQTLDGANIRLRDEEDRSPYSARSFLRTNRSIVSIPPGGTGKIFIEGSVPANVGEGGRYALVSLSKYQEPNKSGNGGVGVGLAIDIPVILTIKDTELIKSGEITGLMLSRPIEREMQNISLIFVNTGNYHYRALANVTIENKEGDILASGSTPISFSSIIPDNKRLFNISIVPEEGLKPGNYSLNAMVSLEDGNILDTEKTSFEVMP